MSNSTLGSLPQTLLSTIQNIQSRDSVSHATHQFASSAGSSGNVLQDIIQATTQLSNSLNLYSSANFTEPKLISRLKEHANTSHSLHLSDLNVHQIVDALKKRTGVKYGEDIPLDRAALVDWCISRFEAWGTSVGMETFKDEIGEETVSLVLGGKVLVVDVEFSVNRLSPLPSIKVMNVKTSYANFDTAGSASLDAFLATSMSAFCDAVQMSEADVNPLEAARLGTVVNSHLRYLVMLDRLANRKEDGGIRWFVDVDQLCHVLEDFAKAEAQAVSSSLLQHTAPLDIFLLRAHALPLPYLMSPCISFLIHLSPASYLRLLRQSSDDIVADPVPHLPQLDIPLSRIRTFLSSRPQTGVAIATLTLSPEPDFHSSASVSMPALNARPIFPLVPGGIELEHLFPQTFDSPLDLHGEPFSKPSWILDFTQGGSRPGVVMSQSRMREIELVVNPLSSIDQLDNIMSFGTGSWVDILFNPSEADPSSPVSPERYTSIYRSPSSAHPPLQLRLTAPEEPGFVLERVPVHSMKEAWGVLEIVREQCWLNEILLGCKWTAEGLPSETDVLSDDTEPTEQDLLAVLGGTNVPHKIPVNVFLLQSRFNAENMDGISVVNDQRPRIFMVAPERPPISGSVGINITYDESKPRGICVEVNGAMGVDIKVDLLEEVCRRGGTFGLPGRIWASASGSS
ncbi:hypothetical protein EDD18DRAFT_320630 [Armillaria luteobubalina]|uniref:Mediator complex subunit 1 n=1 Tax=Armillaria luteobubalina TaxID=153913 RepID=A0AA39U074_9AGAR|nr:hypothetical protein EDD18DRAFT_320630 [Armillaria luteobubalina]